MSKKFHIIEVQSSECHDNCWSPHISTSFQFSSVQRVHRFSQLKAEGEAVSATRPTSLWPQYGIVTFEGVTMVLEEEGQKVLKNLWCCIRAEEKVRFL